MFQGLRSRYRTAEIHARVQQLILQALCFLTLMTSTTAQLRPILIQHFNTPTLPMMSPHLTTVTNQIMAMVLKTNLIQINHFLLPLPPQLLLCLEMTL